MALGPYDPCPCGSGNKLKFCCHEIVPEMEKMAKYQENQKPHMALKLLDSLNEKYPENPWILTSLAAIHIGDSGYAKAKEALKTLLNKHPDHLLAISLYATASFTSDGYEASRRAIQSAFQHCSKAIPDLVEGLSRGISTVFFSEQRYMACRYYLTHAMRLSREQTRQDVFIRLLEFDSNDQIPYPIRSVHQLLPFEGSEENRLEVRKISRLCDIGCLGAAAKKLKKVIESDSENAGLWHNLGLIHSWDGRESDAAVALHKSAELNDDYSSAIESEILAQLLDFNSTDDVVKICSQKYDLDSVSKLLTELDKNPRFARMEIPFDESEQENSPAGIFQILDRDEEPGKHPQKIEDVPNVLAQFTIYNKDWDQPESNTPAAYVTGFEGDELDEACKLIESASSDLKKSSDETALNTVETVSKDQIPFYWRWHITPQTPGILRKKLEQEKWHQVIFETWVNQPLSYLKGKSPKEAAKDDSLKKQLCASLYTLDSLCERNHYSLDLEELNNELGCELLPTIEVNDETNFNSFSVIQINQLPVEDLTDEQINYALNRALLISHSRFLLRTFNQVLNRPECKKNVDLNRVYLTLTDIAQSQNKQDDALKWIAAGLEEENKNDKSFENILQWKMRELAVRLDNPEDSGLNDLLNEFNEKYIPKVPQLKAHLAQLLQMFGIDSPFDLSDDLSTNSPNPGGIWTPDQENETSGDQKLWVPE